MHICCKRRFLSFYTLLCIQIGAHLWSAKWSWRVWTMRKVFSALLINISHASHRPHWSETIILKFSWNSMISPKNKCSQTRTIAHSHTSAKSPNNSFCPIVCTPRRRINSRRFMGLLTQLWEIICMHRRISKKKSVLNETPSRWSLLWCRPVT